MKLSPRASPKTPLAALDRHSSVALRPLARGVNRASADTALFHVHPTGGATAPRLWERWRSGRWRWVPCQWESWRSTGADTSAMVAARPAAVRPAARRCTPAREGGAPSSSRRRARRYALTMCTSTAAAAPAADPSAGGYARSRRCGCRGSRSIAYPPSSSRDNAARRRYSARPCSNRIADNGRPGRRG
jgi:hypothetical protein